MLGAVLAFLLVALAGPFASAAAPAPAASAPVPPVAPAGVVAEAGMPAQLVAGAFHNCLLESEGGATCWGADDHGESSPPPGLWTSLAAGYHATCGIHPGGSAECWGDPFSTAGLPAGLWTSIVGLDSHWCGLHPDGSAECWGANGSGQTDAPAGTFTAVTVGSSHSCGLRPDATAECWGSPLAGPTPPGPWTSIAATYGGATCGIHPDHSAECWGNDAAGRLDVPAGSWASITGGGGNFCGVHLDDTAECWGPDAYGQNAVPPGRWALVAAGGQHTCGIHVGGMVECWGSKEWGQSIEPRAAWTQVTTGVGVACALADDGTAECWGPQLDARLDIPPGPWVQVDAGADSACGLHPDGSAECWGVQANGTLEPTPPRPFRQVAVGWSGACGLRVDDGIVCWGASTTPGGAPSPLLDVPPGPWTSVSLTWVHACGLHPDGTGACWGEDQDGQLQVPGGTWVSISAGGGHSCGVRPDGTGACWGDDKYGQRDVPTGPWTSIDAGTSNSCGRRPDGTGVCWGTTNYPLRSLTGPWQRFGTGPLTMWGVAADGSVHTAGPWQSVTRLASRGAVSGASFTAVAPVRILDSRTATGGWNSPLPAGVTRTVGVAGLAGVPVGATAVVLNVTATNPTAASYLVAHPAGTVAPTAANLLYAPGQTVANHVTVPVGPGGAIAFTNQLGNVDVIADLVGWYAPDTARPAGPDATGDRYDPTTPTRILDTRTGLGTTSGPVGPDGTIDLTIAGVAGVPAGATAVVFNLTATEPTAPTYVQAYPAGTTRPDTANLLVAPGQTLPNLVTVALGTNGKVSLFNQQGNVHLIADLVGWYQPDTGDLFRPITPTRLLDSRTPLGGFNGPIGPNTAKTLTVTGGPIPTGATALVANLTATGGTAATYLAAGPTPTPIPAPTANLLAAPGQTIPNAATITLAPTGTLDLYNQQGATHTILDATGWFGPT